MQLTTVGTSNYTLHAHDNYVCVHAYACMCVYLRVRLYVHVCAYMCAVHVCMWSIVWHFVATN